MATDYRIVWAAGLALMTVGVLGCDRAKALESKDIAGKWCTSGGIEQFDRDRLTAVPAGVKEQHVYPIERYDFHAPSTMHGARAASRMGSKLGGHPAPLRTLRF